MGLVRAACNNMVSLPNTISNMELTHIEIRGIVMSEGNMVTYILVSQNISLNKGGELKKQ